MARDPGLPIVSLDLSHIAGSDTLLGLVMTCASTWMEAVLRDPAGGQRLVVHDEAWRLMAQPALLARMQAQWKLSRAWGLANLIILHRLSDLEAVGDTGSQARGLAQGLLGDTATRIISNQPYDEATAVCRILGLAAVEADQLPELVQGEGLWRIGQHAFMIRNPCPPIRARNVPLIAVHTDVEFAVLSPNSRNNSTCARERSTAPGWLCYDRTIHLGGSVRHSTPWPSFDC